MDREGRRMGGRGHLVRLGVPGGMDKREDTGGRAGKGVEEGRGDLEGRGVQVDMAEEEDRGGLEGMAVQEGMAAFLTGVPCSLSISLACMSKLAGDDFPLHFSLHP